MKWLRELLAALLAAWRAATAVSHPAVIEDKGEAPKVDPGAVQPPTPASEPHNGDDLDLATVDPFTVQSQPGVTPAKLIAAKVTAKLTLAETNGDKLYVAYDSYRELGWPVKGQDKAVDAIAYFFYVGEDGKPTGGKFDFWRHGGQPIKTLENVHQGYGGMAMPQKGRDCWTMISNLDGTERSNTKRVTWK